MAHTLPLGTATRYPQVLDQSWESIPRRKGTLAWWVHLSGRDILLTNPYKAATAVLEGASVLILVVLRFRHRKQKRIL